MTQFVKEVEALKIKVQLEFAKIETLDLMITMIQKTYDDAIETAYTMEDRQFRRYQAAC